MNNMDFDALMISSQGFNTMDKVANSGVNQSMTQQTLQNIQAMQTPTFEGYMPKSPVLPIFEKQQEQKTTQQFFVLLNNEQKGPFTLEQIRGFYNAGMINESTMAWVSGMQNWADLKTCLSYLKI